jgi:hypothetical protein
MKVFHVKARKGFAQAAALDIELGESVLHDVITVDGQPTFQIQVADSRIELPVDEIVWLFLKATALAESGTLKKMDMRFPPFAAATRKDEYITLDSSDYTEVTSQLQLTGPAKESRQERMRRRHQMFKRHQLVKRPAEKKS